MSRGRPLMTSELRTMRVMSASGATLSDVVRVLGRPYPTVMIWSARHGLKFKNSKRGHPPRPPRLMCAKDHYLDGDNLYIAPDGRRRCRACMAAYDRKRLRTASEIVQARKVDTWRQRSTQALTAKRKQALKVQKLSEFLLWAANHSTDPVTVSLAIKIGKRFCITANSPAAPIPAPAPGGDTAPEPAPGRPQKIVMGTPFSVMAYPFGQMTKSPPSWGCGNTDTPPPASEPASASARTP